MRIPELVYNFAQLKDVAGGLNLIVVREVVDSQTSAQVLLTVLEVPNDKIFILSAASSTSVPGGAQTILDNQLFTGENPPPSFEIARSEAGVVNLNFSGEVWVPPGAVVQSAGNFSAGAVANTHGCSIHGFLIPRGNVQQG